MYLVNAIYVQPTIDQWRLARAFGRANPLIIRTLAGDAYTLADWGTTRNLHTALAKLYPTELGGGGGGGAQSLQLHGVAADATGTLVEISPEYGGPGRQQLLAGEFGCDQLVLTFNVPSATSTQPLIGSTSA